MMERVEEYLETILDIQKEGRVAKTKEIADRLKIKPSSVTEMLNKLSDMGYVDYQPYRGATLTKDGYKVAERIKRNYLIFMKFFGDFLELDSEKAHELSCTLEHIVDDSVIEKICVLISGRCDLCESCGREYMRLDEVREGKYVIVASPFQLEKIGLAPNKEIEVRNGEIVIDEKSLNLSDDMKKLILLKPL